MERDSTSGATKCITTAVTRQAVNVDRILNPEHRHVQNQIPHGAAADASDDCEPHERHHVQTLARARDCHHTFGGGNEPVTGGLRGIDTRRFLTEIHVKIRAAECPSIHAARHLSGSRRRLLHVLDADVRFVIAGSDRGEKAEYSTLERNFSDARGLTKCHHHETELQTIRDSCRTRVRPRQTCGTAVPDCHRGKIRSLGHCCSPAHLSRVVWRCIRPPPEFVDRTRASS